MDSRHNYRGYGSRYRDRTPEKLDRRRPVERVSRNFSYLPTERREDTRRSRDDDGYQHRRHDGNSRRFSRFDSRDSPRPRRRRSPSSSRSQSRSRSPVRRPERDNRPTETTTDKRTSFSARFRPRPVITAVEDPNVERSNTNPSDGQPPSEPVPDTGGISTPLDNPPPQFQPSLTAEQNHIPRIPLGPQFYPPPLTFGPAPVPFSVQEKPREKAVDEDVVRKILENLKSKGVIDQFRKTFLEECDDKPDFKRLRERVRKTVTSFLDTRTWLPQINKNTERHNVRRRILESSYFARELDEMLDRCFAEAESYFMPHVEDSVYEFLGIEKPPQDEELEDDETKNESEAEIEVDEGDGDKEDSEGEDSVSGSSGSSYMDVDSTEDEGDPPPLPQSSVPTMYNPSLIPGRLGHGLPPLPSFDRISQLVPNHPPPPPLPPPLGFGRHIPILSNTIMRRNPIENPPLPPSDDDGENPPLPSEEESSSESESEKESDSEEISVGHASPPMVEDDNSVSQSSILQPQDDEGEESGSVSMSTPVDPSVPERSPGSNLEVKVDDKLLPSESDESPQPPPPGEEEVFLPLFSSVQESVTEPVVVIDNELLPLPVALLPTIPAPPEQLEVEPHEIPLPEFDDEIRLLSGDCEGIPLPAEPILEDGELEAEIALPVATAPEGIPLPLEPDSPASESESESEDSDSSEADSPSPPPSPLLRAHAEIPLPPRCMSEDREIPLPPPFPSSSFVHAFCGSLSPVTSGDLDDISDDSIPFPPSDGEELEEGEIEMPASPVRKDRDDDDIGVVSSTVEIETIEFEPEMNMGLGVDEETAAVRIDDEMPPVQSSLSPEVTPATVSPTGEKVDEATSPLEMSVQADDPTVTLSMSPTFPETLESALDVQVPVPLDMDKPRISVLDLAMSPVVVELPLSPIPLLIAEPPPSPIPLPVAEPPSEPPQSHMPPPPPPLPPICIPTEADNNVFEEEDDDWESPAFEKFGETSPPRIDHVETESFENLAHVSPQKKGTGGGIMEVKVKKEEQDHRRSSSSRHRDRDRDRDRHPHSSHHSKDRTSDYRPSSGSRSDRDRKRKHSSSRSRMEEESSRPRHKSHKSDTRSHSDSRSNKKSEKGYSTKGSPDRRSRSRDRRHRDLRREEESRSSASSSAKDFPGAKSDVMKLATSPMPRVVLKRCQGLGPRTLLMDKMVPMIDPIPASLSMKVSEPETLVATRTLPSTIESITADMTVVPVTVVLAQNTSSMVVIDGERIEPVQYFEPIPSFLEKIRYYTKYLDPLLMDDDVSVDGEGGDN